MKALASITFFLFVCYLSRIPESSDLEELTSGGAQVHEAGSGLTFTEGCSMAPEGRVLRYICPAK